MTALPMYRPWTRWTVRRFSVVRPLVVAAGVIAAGAMLPALAHADPPSGPVTGVLNNPGTGNNGSLSNTMAGLGQSICPMLVKPGATVASVASQVAGGMQVSPAIAGLAIQMGCPGFMTSLANGKMPFPLQVPGVNPAPQIPFLSPGH
jgi:hypothetical protein